MEKLPTSNRNEQGDKKHSVIPFYRQYRDLVRRLIKLPNDQILNLRDICVSEGDVNEDHFGKYIPSKISAKIIDDFNGLRQKISEGKIMRAKDRRVYCTTGNIAPIDRRVFWDSPEFEMVEAGGNLYHEFAKAILKANWIGATKLLEAKLEEILKNLPRKIGDSDSIRDILSSKIPLKNKFLELSNKLNTPVEWIFFGLVSFVLGIGYKEIQPEGLIENFFQFMRYAGIIERDFNGNDLELSRIFLSIAGGVGSSYIIWSIKNTVLESIANTASFIGGTKEVVRKNFVKSAIKQRYRSDYLFPTYEERLLEWEEVFLNQINEFFSRNDIQNIMPGVGFPLEIAIKDAYYRLLEDIISENGNTKITGIPYNQTVNDYNTHVGAIHKFIKYREKYFPKFMEYIFPGFNNGNIQNDQTFEGVFYMIQEGQVNYEERFFNELEKLHGSLDNLSVKTGWNQYASIVTEWNRDLNILIYLSDNVKKIYSILKRKIKVPVLLKAHQDWMQGLNAEELRGGKIKINIPELSPFLFSVLQSHIPNIKETLLYPLSALLKEFPDANEQYNISPIEIWEQELEKISVDILNFIGAIHLLSGKNCPGGSLFSREDTLKIDGLDSVIGDRKDNIETEISEKMGKLRTDLKEAIIKLQKEHLQLIVQKQELQHRIEVEIIEAQKIIQDFISRFENLLFKFNSEHFSYLVGLRTRTGKRTVSSGEQKKGELTGLLIKTYEKGFIAIKRKYHDICNIESDVVKNDLLQKLKVMVLEIDSKLSEAKSIFDMRAIDFEV